jgi:hypothetical protein
VSLDASRLARNNSDWHRLLELCGLFQTLIADAERLYDPQAYHDRLLLGLSGIMSEAELHHLKLRLHAGGGPGSLMRRGAHACDVSGVEEISIAQLSRRGRLHVLRNAAARCGASAAEA